MSRALWYEYRAVRSDGAVECGVLEADSRSEAEAVLAARGLFPVELGAVSARRRPGSSVPAADLALSLRTLSDLLAYGHPIQRALSLLRDLAPPRFARYVDMVQDRVRRGRRLSDGLEATGVVPQVATAIVQAGEVGGDVVPALKRAAELLEQRAARAAALQSALVYPAILVAAAAVSVGLLVGVVIPRFAAVVAEVGMPLPRATQVVLRSANVARVAAVPVALVAAALWVLWRHRQLPLATRVQVDRLLLDVPIAGRVLFGASGARVAQSAAALIAAGLPVAAALGAAATTAGNAAVCDRVLAARERVIGGTSVAAALAEERALPESVVRVIAAGEHAGSLANGFLQGAQLEGERVARRIHQIVMLVEPALLIVLALLVALIAVALVQAVYAVRPMGL